MSSAKALKKKIAKRAKQKKNIQVKNSIRLKHKAGTDAAISSDTATAEADTSPTEATAPAA